MLFSERFPTFDRTLAERAGQVVRWQGENRLARRPIWVNLVIPFAFVVIRFPVIRAAWQLRLHDTPPQIGVWPDRHRNKLLGVPTSWRAASRRPSLSDPSSVRMVFKVLAKVWRPASDWLPVVPSTDLFEPVTEDTVVVSSYPLKCSVKFMCIWRPVHQKISSSREVGIQHTRFLNEQSRTPRIVATSSVRVSRPPVRP